MGCASQAPGSPGDHGFLKHAGGWVCTLEKGHEGLHYGDDVGSEQVMEELEFDAEAFAIWNDEGEILCWKYYSAHGYNLDFDPFAYQREDRSTNGFKVVALF